MRKSIAIIAVALPNCVEHSDWVSNEMKADTRLLLEEAMKTIFGVLASTSKNCF